MTSTTSRMMSGFTLIELACCIAIIAITATLAAPSYIALHFRHQTQVDHDNLKQSLAYARSHARITGVRTSVCIANFKKCSGLSGRQLMVFESGNALAPLQITEVAKHSSISSNRKHPVSFTSTGASTTASISYCTKKRKLSNNFHITLNGAGRAYSSRDYKLPVKGCSPPTG